MLHGTKRLSEIVNMQEAINYIKYVWGNLSGKKKNRRAKDTDLPYETRDTLNEVFTTSCKSILEMSGLRAGEIEPNAYCLLDI